MKKAFNRSQKKFIFVTKKDKLLRNTNHYIILSPEFYWVKKVKLPVKSISSAKKLAASLFEGSLPEGKYSYEIRKAGDEFVVIAYDKDRILDELKKVFPAKSSFKEIYFAQDIFKDLKDCVAVNERSALANIDGIIVAFPRSCTNSTSKIDDFLDMPKPRKHKIKLTGSSDELLERKDVVLLSVLSLVIASSFLLEYFNYKSASTALEEQRAKIIKEYKLPPTMIQLRSIKKSLSKKFKSQKSIRELLSLISKLNLKDKEYIQNLQLDGRSLSLDIHIADPKRESKIKKDLQKSAKIQSSSIDSDTLKLRISL